MRKIYLTIIVLVIACAICISFTDKTSYEVYANCYAGKLSSFRKQQRALLQTIQQSDIHTETGIATIKEQIALARREMKGMDFWMRYLEPIAYKKVNGPLPVEWETEVFEKFEKPYKREGAGLTLAELYLDEEDCKKDSLQNLINASLTAYETYAADSITSQLSSYHHFYLANRLFLLNLAAIYTTGFECPDTAAVIPELLEMLQANESIYKSFNQSFGEQSLSPEYLQLYQNAIAFVQSQPQAYTVFDHFSFIKNYVNPLYATNQKLIKQYRVFSKSYVDYTLNKNNYSIFNKALYNGQNPKGIFLRVDDSTELAEINRVGKLLFYDPILSGNNLRSCNSCHKSTEYFTDTAIATSLQFNGKDNLARNTPSLLGTKFNHLLMLDGKHYTMQAQMKEVLFNPTEMGSVDKDVLKKILSCKEYKQAFTRLLKLTPQEKEITLDHVASAVTYYYSKFSDYYAPFDDAMNGIATLDFGAKQGFNLFMSKAQCATCHFVPNFNGVKPPYVGSEFEVLGVPADKKYTKLSADKGRWELNNATETMNAIRTGSIRNAAHTAPYMHNGVFNTLAEVIDFYDGGGGAGHHLDVPNQTLSSDSLHLTPNEKSLLITFIQSLDEKIAFEAPPKKLPLSSNAMLNRRKVGGVQ